MAKSAVGNLLKAIFLAAPPALVDKDYNELTLTPDARLRTDASIAGPVIVTPSEPTFTPQGYQQITVTNVATSTLTVPAAAKYAYVICRNADLRWRDDGVAPTNAVGFFMPTQLTFFFQNGHAGLVALQFITTGAASGELNVSYYS